MVDFLLKQKASFFKRSVKRMDKNFEFVPNNLHLQRMRVQNVTTRKTGVYDIITVGVFTASSCHYNQGGLLKLLNQLKGFYPEVSNVGSAILGPDPISRAAEAILRLVKLKEDVEEDIAKLISFQADVCQKTVQNVLNSLSSKGDELTRICTPHAVESSLMLWDSLRSGAPTNVLSDFPKALSHLDTPVKLKKSGKNQESSKPIASTGMTLIASKQNGSSSTNSKADNAEYVNEKNSQTLTSNRDLDSTDNIKTSEDKTNKQNLGMVKSHEEIEPLDLTHLNIKASIMCMASKVQSYLLGKDTKVTESNIQSKNWADELMPSINKLRQAIQCLLKTANLTYSMILLKESTNSMPLSQKVRHRRDIVFSQALTAQITGLMTRLWCRNLDSAFLYTLRTVGVLCDFEGLLSCYSHGMAMLEDMVVGIDDLRRVIFWLEPSSVSTNPQPRITGTRLFLCVHIPVPQSVINLLPAEYSSGFRFNVCSVFFNIGINEKATLAEKFGDVLLQEKINQDSFSILKDYFSRFQRVAKSQRNHGFHFAESHIIDLLDQLESQINATKSKNVVILHISSEICKHMGGIRFTSCKSAKDRTGMSVTLEQATVLLKDFNLDENEFLRVLECMRSEGTRRENTLKNCGARKYHFTILQVMALPKMYRPPTGTFGKIVS